MKAGADAQLETGRSGLLGGRLMGIVQSAAGSRVKSIFQVRVTPEG